MAIGTVKVVNDEKNKIVDIVCDCDTLWSFAHQFSYLRLSDKTGENKYHFINLYAARARRIAATYARFYLELEDGGDKSKIGRYYWMGLAAFASKSVGCLLDEFTVKNPYKMGKYLSQLFDANSDWLKPQAVGDGLGQGNLWLFMDIASSHWFYNHYPEHFKEGMECEIKRHSSNLEPPVKKVLNDLPWAEETLPEVNFFKPTEKVIEAFELTKQIEGETDVNKRLELQIEQLLATAIHEQGPILQNLIYNNPDFSSWTKRQRKWYIQWLSPTYQLSFSHLCDIKDDNYKSVAPDDMIVEDYDSRMEWINQVAKDFHKLMQRETEHMMRELNIIAQWVDEPDAKMVI